MIERLITQGLTEGKQRAQVEQFLSNDPSIYSVEDDKFLYYAQKVEKDGETMRIFHIVKGKVDYSMEISEWEDFIALMEKVSDDFFVTGEGKPFTEVFLGNYLSKYSRRHNFVDELAYIIEDAKGWLIDDKQGRG